MPARPTARDFDRELLILFDAHVHGDVDRHGFHNDTSPRCDAAAAKQAWDRTIAFFKAHLAA